MKSSRIATGSLAGLCLLAMSLLVVALIGAVWTSSEANVHAQAAAAQESSPHVISDQDLDLLRKDLRSKRKQLIAANLTLTDVEATKFWPVYDKYVAELIEINDKKFGLIQEYANNYGKLTDEQSLSFIRRGWMRTLQQHSCGRSTCRLSLRYWLGERQQLFFN